MALPIISALAAIDPRLKEASIALGAGRRRTLFQVVLPLSLPGVIAGVRSRLQRAGDAIRHGGGRLVFMPLYIYQQGVQAQNWPFASAIALSD
jgi:putative spermidine/putrescine transport system permease protein